MWSLPMPANRKAEKVLIIGLDCADPKLVFDRFYDELPNLRSLTQRGLFGPMQSCIPPITIPAWSCMASSKDPGQLGVYGMRNRADWSYDKLNFATSQAITEPLLWDILGQYGKKSFAFAVPQTYPPKPIKGWKVCSFLTPSIQSEYTYPSSLKAEIASLVGDYRIDVRGYRTDQKDWLLDEIYKMTEQHFTVIRHYMAKCDWDLFWLVELGPDRIHHGFWQFMDPQHHRYEKGNRFEHAIRDYYKFLDVEIGKLLAQVDLDRTAVWVVSDHGAKLMKGGVCFNDWLIDQGYLKLKDDLPGPTRFADVNIDWSATKAWGEGGYYGRCFINVEGREPHGIVPQSQYESFCRELIEKLESMPDHQGKPMGTKVYRPDQIYRAVKGFPPDLIVLFGEMDWRSVGTVGTGGLYTFENDTGPDDANHALNGIFICTGPGVATKEGVANRQIGIYDLAPSVLTQMGLPVPPDMIGRSILPA
jgi:predicted AlkP superfamily phosphohydrolase/phosphomutase